MMSLDFSQSIRRSYNVNKSGVVLIVPHHFWDSLWWQPFIGCHLSVLCQVLGFNIIDLDNT